MDQRFRQLIRDAQTGDRDAAHRGYAMYLRIFPLKRKNITYEYNKKFEGQKTTSTNYQKKLTFDDPIIYPALELDLENLPLIDPDTKEEYRMTTNQWGHHPYWRMFVKISKDVPNLQITFLDVDTNVHSERFRSIGIVYNFDPKTKDFVLVSEKGKPWSNAQTCTLEELLRYPARMTSKENSRHIAFRLLFASETVKLWFAKHREFLIELAYRHLRAYCEKQLKDARYKMMEHQKLQEAFYKAAMDLVTITDLPTTYAEKQA